MNGGEVTADGDARTLCRWLPDAPCAVEERLRESLLAENLRLATALHEEIGNRLFGTAMCLAAVRSRIAATDPSLAQPLEAIGAMVTEAAVFGREAACSASAFLATHHGLEIALQMRFGPAAAPGAPCCDLVLQPDAAQGLSADEQSVLLQVAEQAVWQIAREGTPRARIALRRSRLGTVDLAVSGDGGAANEAGVAECYRSLAAIRRLAARIEARIGVRRLADGCLLVRCGTRWNEEQTGRWASPQ